MKAIVLIIITVVAILAVAVLARQMSNCICSFTGPCKKASDGVAIRYYQCQGSCYGYSDYERYPKCENPNYQPRELLAPAQG